MNWTGGQLHRHAKSRKNAHAKAQKQHFASVIFPKCKELKYVRLPANHSHRESQANEHAEPHEINETYIPQSASGEPERATNVNTTSVIPPKLQNSIPAPRAAQSQLTNQNVTHKSTKSHFDNVEQMKKRLLGQADWLELSSSRPVQFNFPTAEERASLGRHQKPLGDKVQNTIDRQSAFAKQVMSPVLGKRKREEISRISRAKVEDNSCGTAPPTRSPSFYWASSPPGVGEVSSLNTMDTPTRSSPSLPPVCHYDPDRSQYRLEQDHEQIYGAQDTLIPLEHVRSFASFDDIGTKQLEMLSRASKSPTFQPQDRQVAQDQLDSAVHFHGEAASHSKDFAEPERSSAMRDHLTEARWAQSSIGIPNQANPGAAQRLIFEVGTPKSRLPFIARFSSKPLYTLDSRGAEHLQGVIASSHRRVESHIPYGKDVIPFSNEQIEAHQGPSTDSHTPQPQKGDSRTQTQFYRSWEAEKPSTTRRSNSLQRLSQLDTPNTTTQEPHRSPFQILSQELLMMVPPFGSHPEMLNAQTSQTDFDLADDILPLSANRCWTTNETGKNRLLALTYPSR